MRGSESSISIRARKASFDVSAACRQKGAYAVEFALVFIVFFLVLYGMITYGLIFAAQQSMNFAAESGARAGLQWQAGNSALALVARANKALAIADDHTNWVDTMAGGNKLKIGVCGGEPIRLLSASNGADASLCTITDPNKLEIVIRYPYALHPMIPYLGPSSIMRVVVPETLESRTSVDLGIALDHSS
ncbi:TadE/TadG family type IV pilus assembly protein [Advenella alkanexedens]|uniref:TadE/TadG family type IV pilus assembly protein n=1 Tax=Advenella alkanexedens TaxID=1481665 RepID=UPI002674B3B0|nr:TadE/TadG family type IV pilus assembly protein [Advenella alkanexedens]WKU19607.1 TadE/TadG family type IV pilus assembly protein [Advenella alkanexedens]